MKPAILITEQQFAKGGDVFEACAEVDCISAPGDEAPLAKMVEEKQAKAVIVGVEKYTGALYSALANGIISRFGVGYDSISREQCRKHNVILTNTPGVLDVSVAEHAVFLMGALVRSIPQSDHAMRAGSFQASAGAELFGKTLLVAGFGRIGRRMAAIAGFGLGMNVIAFGRTPLADHADAQQITSTEFLAKYSLSHYTTDIDSALPGADFISIHMASNDKTHHFFDARRLALCKKACSIINTARGPIIDESALFDALSQGRLAGAAIDVFEHEPYQPVHPAKDLRTLSNVVLTPHVGSNPLQANRRMTEMSLMNCLYFYAGQFDKLTRVW